MSNLLKKYFENFKSCVVALSGGRDSAAVLKLAVEYLGEENVVAATCVNPNVFLYEINNAFNIAKFFNVSWIPFYVDFSEEFLNNPKDKCYYCKKGVLNKLVEIKDNIGADVVFDGTNVDDLDDYRPGLKALEELNVKSPLLENSLGKSFAKNETKILEDIAGIYFTVESCAATRIMEDKITLEKLRVVERVEDELRFKYPTIRVRLYSSKIVVEFKKAPIDFSFNDKDYVTSVIKKYLKVNEINFNL